MKKFNDSNYYKKGRKSNKLSIRLKTNVCPKCGHRY